MLLPIEGEMLPGALCLLMQAYGDAGWFFIGYIPLAAGGVVVFIRDTTATLTAPVGVNF